MDRDVLEKLLITLDPRIRQKEQADRAAVDVPSVALFGLMQKLHDDERLAFDMLLDHTAIDHLAQNRFELVYNLYSTTHGHYVMVNCDIDRINPVAPTVSPIWPIAHWQEREVFDLLGIHYDGHTDLRRVFLEDDWQGHPLRKDYKDADMLEFPQ
jgi:NADH-quinone oxidoreductase subunit C